MAGIEKTVFGISVLTNVLLLLGAGRFCRISSKWHRIILAGILGGVHAIACMHPQFYFLGNVLWRAVSLGVMAMVAYGISLSALRRGIVFSFLTLALEGILTGIGRGGAWGVLSVAGVLCLMCYLSFRQDICKGTYVPVELSYGDKRLCLTALQDTGNTLRDPITGRQVLVVGAEAARELTGLTRQQLLTPIESVVALPGLRLIPYHSIGNRSFLLAMRFQNVKIGSWQGSSLVAFAPEGLGMDGNYQALTGGIL